MWQQVISRQMPKGGRRPHAVPAAPCPHPQGHLSASVAAGKAPSSQCSPQLTMQPEPNTQLHSNPPLILPAFLARARPKPKPSPKGALMPVRASCNGRTGCPYPSSVPAYQKPQGRVWRIPQLLHKDLGPRSPLRLQPTTVPPRRMPAAVGSPHGTGGSAPVSPRKGASAHARGFLQTAQLST